MSGRAATDNDVVTIRVLLVAGLVVLAAACGLGSDRYSVEDTRAAFESEGYELVEPPPDPSGFALNPWESGEPVVLAPSDGASFKVYIGETDAEEALAAEGPEFQAHRANVLVVSEGELVESHRTRIRTALEELPDRGSPVVLVPAD